MAERGFEVAGPAPNKVLSDALRVEVRRERVRRVGRGRFEIGQVARTTAWRVQHRWTWADGPTTPVSPP